MLKKGDIIFLLVLAFGISLGALLQNDRCIITWNNMISHCSLGDIIAVVKKDGEIIKIINLSKSKREIIKLSDQHDATIIAENKKIRFLESCCPDKTCVINGWLSKPGDMSVCLHNRMIIKIQHQD